MTIARRFPTPGSVSIMDLPHAKPAEPMPQTIAHIALVARDYDEAVAYFAEKPGFELIEDTPLKNYPLCLR